MFDASNPPYRAACCAQRPPCADLCWSCAFLLGPRCSCKKPLLCKAGHVRNVEPCSVRDTRPPAIRPPAAQLQAGCALTIAAKNLAIRLNSHGRADGGDARANIIRASIESMISARDRKVLGDFASERHLLKKGPAGNPRAPLAPCHFSMLGSALT